MLCNVTKSSPMIKVTKTVVSLLIQYDTRNSQHSKECKDPRTPALFYFVTRDLDVLPFGPKIDWFSGLIVKHFCGQVW